MTAAGYGTLKWNTLLVHHVLLDYLVVHVTFFYGHMTVASIDEVALFQIQGTFMSQ